jgi:DNA polymerase-3 subunit alpha (Gram-positive type)
MKRCLQITLGRVGACILLSFFLDPAGAAAKQPPLAKKTPVSEITFVAFDTETTGFDAKGGRVVEIGAVKFRDGELVAERKWLINPRKPISYWAERAHGITAEMLKDSPLFPEVFPEFKEFIGDCILIAHNAPFDIAFLKAEMKRNQLSTPPNPIIDSLRLFRTWFPDAESHSLERLSKDLGLGGKVYHRAAADSRHIMRIFSKKTRKLGSAYEFGDLVEDAGGVLSF